MNRWIQSAPFDETLQFVCWQVGEEILSAEINLVPELISAIMLLLEDAVGIDREAVVDLGLLEDVERLVQEMHVQYREES